MEGLTKLPNNVVMSESKKYLKYINKLETARDKLTPIVDDIIFTVLKLANRAGKNQGHRCLLTSRQYQDVQWAFQVVKQIQYQIVNDSTRICLPNTNVIVNNFSVETYRQSDKTVFVIDETNMKELLKLYKQMGDILNTATVYPTIESLRQSVPEKGKTVISTHEQADETVSKQISIAEPSSKSISQKSQHEDTQDDFQSIQSVQGATLSDQESITEDRIASDHNTKSRQYDSISMQSAQSDHDKRSVSIASGTRGKPKEYIEENDEFMETAKEEEDFFEAETDDENVSPEPKKAPLASKKSKKPPLGPKKSTLPPQTKLSNDRTSIYIKMQCYTDSVTEIDGEGVEAVPCSKCDTHSTPHVHVKLGGQPVTLKVNQDHVDEGQVYCINTGDDEDGNEILIVIKQCPECCATVVASTAILESHESITLHGTKVKESEMSFSSQETQPPPPPPPQLNLVLDTENIDNSEISFADAPHSSSIHQSLVEEHAPASVAKSEDYGFDDCRCICLQKGRAMALAAAKTSGVSLPVSQPPVGNRSSRQSSFYSANLKQEPVQRSFEESANVDKSISRTPSEKPQSVHNSTPKSPSNSAPASAHSSSYSPYIPPPSRKTSVKPLMRERICSSMEFDVDKVPTRLREQGIEHENPTVVLELENLGVNQLLRACRPARCCRKAVLNERQRCGLPYAVSLRSLPLLANDVEVIKESLNMSLRKIKKSINLNEHSRNKMAYYVSLGMDEFKPNYNFPWVVPVYDVKHTSLEVKKKNHRKEHNFMLMKTDDKLINTIPAKMYKLKKVAMEGDSSLGKIDETPEEDPTQASPKKTQQSNKLMHTRSTTTLRRSSIDTLATDKCNQLTQTNSLCECDKVAVSTETHSSEHYESSESRNTIRISKNKTYTIISRIRHRTRIVRRKKKKRFGFRNRGKKPRTVSWSNRPREVKITQSLPSTSSCLNSDLKSVKCDYPLKKTTKFCGFSGLPGRSSKSTSMLDTPSRVSSSSAPVSSKLSQVWKNKHFIMGGDFLTSSIDKLMDVYLERLKKLDKSNTALIYKPFITDVENMEISKTSALSTISLRTPSTVKLETSKSVERKSSAESIDMSKELFCTKSVLSVVNKSEPPERCPKVIHVPNAGDSETTKYDKIDKSMEYYIELVHGDFLHSRPLSSVNVFNVKKEGFRQNKQSSTTTDPNSEAASSLQILPFRRDMETQVTSHQSTKFEADTSARPLSSLSRRLNRLSKRERPDKKDKKKKTPSKIIQEYKGHFEPSPLGYRSTVISEFYPQDMEYINAVRNKTIKQIEKKEKNARYHESIRYSTPKPKFVKEATNDWWCPFVISASSLPCIPEECSTIKKEKSLKDQLSKQESNNSSSPRQIDSFQSKDDSMKFRLTKDQLMKPRKESKTTSKENYLKSRDKESTLSSLIKEESFGTKASKEGSLESKITKEVSLRSRPDLIKTRISKDETIRSKEHQTKIRPTSKEETIKIQQAWKVEATRSREKRPKPVKEKVIEKVHVQRHIPKLQTDPEELRKYHEEMRARLFPQLDAKTNREATNKEPEPESELSNEELLIAPPSPPPALCSAEKHTTNKPQSIRIQILKLKNKTMEVEATVKNACNKEICEIYKNRGIQSESSTPKGKSPSPSREEKINFTAKSSLEIMINNQKISVLNNKK